MSGITAPGSGQAVNSPGTRDTEATQALGKLAGARKQGLQDG